MLRHEVVPCMVIGLRDLRVLRVLCGEVGSWNEEIKLGATRWSVQGGLGELCVLRGEVFLCSRNVEL